MTLPDLKSMKHLTAQRALTVIALGLSLFIIGDTRQALRNIQIEQALHAEKMQANVVARDAAMTRQSDISQEMLRLLRDLIAIQREACVNAAKTSDQIHACLNPSASFGIGR